MTKNNDEIWKSITGYDGLYEVSNFGRIKALERVYYMRSRTGKPFKAVHKERIKKSYLDQHGIEVIMLTDEKSIIRRYKVARLVAMEFLEDFDKYPDVIHIDGNKRNNRVDNLMMSSDHNTGRITRDLGNRTSRKIRCIETNEIFYNAQEITQKYGWDYSCIHKACKGKYEQAYGYHWEYVKNEV